MGYRTDYPPPPVTTTLLFSEKIKNAGALTVTHLMPNGDEIPLYEVRFSKAQKPNVKITPCPNPSQPHYSVPQPIGEVTYHSWSSKIETTIYGQPVQMKRKDTFSAGAHFFNAAPLSVLNNGDDLKWKEGSSGTLKLKGSGAEALAMYRKKMDKPYKTRDGLQILFPLNDRASLDAVVVTGVAIAKYRADSDKEWAQGLEDVFDEL